MQETSTLEQASALINSGNCSISDIRKFEMKIIENNQRQIYLLTGIENFDETIVYKWFKLQDVAEINQLACDLVKSFLEDKQYFEIVKQIQMKHSQLNQTLMNTSDDTKHETKFSQDILEFLPDHVKKNQEYELIHSLYQGPIYHDSDMSNINEVKIKSLDLITYTETKFSKDYDDIIRGYNQLMSSKFYACREHFFQAYSCSQNASLDQILNQDKGVNLDNAFGLIIDGQKNCYSLSKVGEIKTPSQLKQKLLTSQNTVYLLKLSYYGSSGEKITCEVLKYDEKFFTWFLFGQRKYQISEVAGKNQLQWGNIKLGHRAELYSLKKLDQKNYDKERFNSIMKIHEFYNRESHKSVLEKWKVQVHFSDQQKDQNDMANKSISEVSSIHSNSSKSGFSSPTFANYFGQLFNQQQQPKNLNDKSFLDEFEKLSKEQQDLIISQQESLQSKMKEKRKQKYEEKTESKLQNVIRKQENQNLIQGNNKDIDGNEFV